MIIKGIRGTAYFVETYGMGEGVDGYTYGVKLNDAPDVVHKSVLLPQSSVPEEDFARGRDYQRSVGMPGWTWEEYCDKVVQDERDLIHRLMALVGFGEEHAQEVRESADRAENELREVFEQILDNYKGEGSGFAAPQLNFDLLRDLHAVLRAWDAFPDKS